MKNGWDQYAIKNRKVLQGYLRKHCDGGSGRKAREASRSNCLFSRQKEKTEEINVLQGISETLQHQEIGQSEDGIARGMPNSRHAFTLENSFGKQCQMQNVCDGRSKKKQSKRSNQENMEDGKKTL